MNIKASSQFGVSKKHTSSHAFTIVELLVVIVVIGILAAITIVSYTGITQKAVAASIQSDLTNAANKIKMFYVDNAVYPNSITDCPAPASNNICLTPSSGNTYSYVASNSANPPSFNLTETNTNNTSYYITNDSRPIALASAPLSPVADWIATPQGDHYGNFYDLITRSWATVTRTGIKTTYDPATQHIYDVPVNYLAINPRSDNKNGYEAILEESRTNYLLQSSFENTTSGWFYQFAGNGSAASSSDKAIYGNSSLKITRTSAGSEANVWQGLSGLANSTTYYFSAWSWADSPNTACIFTYNASSNLNTVCNSGTSKWERIGGTFISSATGTAQLRLGNSSGNALTSYYFDAAQVELGSFATSYIPTTTTTVARNADVAAIPTTNWSYNANSFAAVFAVNDISPQNHGVFEVTGTSGATNRIYPNWNGASLNGFVYGADASPIYTTNAISTGNYYTAVLTNTGSSVTTYLNGVASSSLATDAANGINGTAYIGGNASITNGPVQRLSVYTSALSSSDTSTVTNAIKNGPQ